MCHITFNVHQLLFIKIKENYKEYVNNISWLFNMEQESVVGFLYKYQESYSFLLLIYARG